MVVISPRPAKTSSTKRAAAGRDGRADPTASDCSSCIPTNRTLIATLSAAFWTAGGSQRHFFRLGAGPVLRAGDANVSVVSLVPRPGGRSGRPPSSGKPGRGVRGYVGGI